MSLSSPDWQTDNQAGLQQELSRIKGCFSSPPGAPLPKDPDAPPAALAQLTEAFGLSAFERDILLLCVGMELDTGFASLCATAQGDPARAYPSFGLALAILPEAHWSAFAPDAPLRHWRLVELGAGPILTRASLRIDERVLYYLLGAGQVDERLTSLLNILPPISPRDLVPSQRRVAGQIAAAWADAERGPDLTIIQLSGPAADCPAIAAAAASALGLRAAALPADRLPHNAPDLDSLLRLWDREAILSGLGVLLIDTDDNLAAESDPGRAVEAAIARLLERATTPVILRAREPRRILTRPTVALEAAHPTSAEQLAIWQASLPEKTFEDTQLAAIASQFSLGTQSIHAIAAELGAHLGGSPPADPAAALWSLCRNRLRGALDGLARRIDTKLTWDDLILPAPQKATLHAIAAQLRQRNKVHEEWGFAGKSQRGLGLGALFHGPSGTGKTMAAEVLASELKLDLYHIDLSRIVSKYIGETEANLRRVFDAAEENGAILLFDEADSLFGTRSEVKDSHDRYANIEVSYLLQRMEAYRGLAILTTNMRAALDPAFMRRIRFAVAFPFPDTPQRAEIWRQVFPPDAPVQGLDHDRLAQLRVAGGNIRNIALNAAFLAADAGEKIQMQHLRDAAISEYAKLDRRLTQAEATAWA